MKRDFAEDQRICEAATVGPWKVYGGKFGETNIYAENVVIACDIDWDKTADAHFIAEAREGWPEALAEIERLRTELTETRGMLRYISYLAEEEAKGDDGDDRTTTEATDTARQGGF